MLSHGGSTRRSLGLEKPSSEGVSSLPGSSFPGPDVKAKVCVFFNVLFINDIAIKKTGKETFICFPFTAYPESGREGSTPKQRNPDRCSRTLVRCPKLMTVGEGNQDQQVNRVLEALD